MKHLLRTFMMALALFAGSPVRAQQTQDQAPAFTAEQLEQLVATIALYSDDLVSQILMASTYPLEIVEADRWQKSNSSLTGDSLAKALDAQTWDASVKSLVNFPQVLDMMSKDLDWMTKLGNAFIANQQDVLAAIQRLRKRAKDAGNLESNDQQKVTVTTAPTETIVIQSASPDVIYVPTYNPTVVYGAWPYPAYPPYAYYPPGYNAAAAAAVSFGIGVACGAAWGNAWGDCDWNGGHVDVDVNRNANLNRNVDRSGQRSGQWSHNPAHRDGVSYRDRGTAERFGRTGSRDAAQAREQFRGRAESGRRDLDRGGSRGDLGRGGNARGSADRRAGGSREGARNRGSGSARGQRGGGSRSAFDRSRGGRSSRSASSRGRSSRSGSARSHGGGRSRGGGARGGGGRSRGGGGGGRGGGRR